MKLQREYCFDYFLSNIVNEEETIRLSNSKLMIHCVECQDGLFTMACLKLRSNLQETIQTIGYEIWVIVKG